MHVDAYIYMYVYHTHVVKLSNPVPRSIQWPEGRRAIFCCVDTDRYVYARIVCGQSILSILPHVVPLL